MKWEDFKQRKINEIGEPIPPGEGATGGKPLRPPHPELRNPGAPLGLDKTSGHDTPADYGEPTMNAKLEIKKALTLANQLFEILDSLPRPYYDKFYGYTEWLGDLRADLSQVK